MASFFGQIGAFSMVNDQNTFGVCVCVHAQSSPWSKNTGLNHFIDLLCIS